MGIDTLYATRSVGACVAFWAALGLAGVPQARAAQTAEQVLEANLLHRSVPLSGLKVYSRAKGEWQPLRPPTAKVVVVNLWSRVCPPCLAELPELRQLVEEWKKIDKDRVQFLFIADPPDQTTAQQVASFWAAPMVDELASHCPGTKMPRGNRSSCLLAVPDVDPVRGEGNQLSLAVGSETRPLTLLLDEQGTIRQVFAGALAGRSNQLTEAIRRLLAVGRGRPALTGRRAAL
jgi:thiol-disulfide isomerase/thioredoxin